MQLVKTKSELGEHLATLPGTKALVMTMGALHEGHLSLVRAARESAQHVVVSIYVNPLQFGPGEDYEAYPRQLDADLALLEPLGVDLVYAPIDADIYPRNPLVTINPGPVAKTFEGKTRPTHFAGVLQIVHKVLNLVRPDFAYFGQKDAQQLALIRTMVADLDMPVEIRAVPIAREASGLALSSRNAYLSEQERATALALSRSLFTARSAAHAGQSLSAVLTAAQQVLDSEPGLKLDYLHAVEPETFLLADSSAKGPVLLVLAAWVGATRLIDNMEVNIA